MAYTISSLSLSLSHPHTHTHTHAISISLSLSLSRTPFNAQHIMTKPQKQKRGKEPLDHHLLIPQLGIERSGTRATSWSTHTWQKKSGKSPEYLVLKLSNFQSKKLAKAQFYRIQSDQILRGCFLAEFWCCKWKYRHGLFSICLVRLGLSLAIA